MQNRNVQVTICPPAGVVAASYSGWVPAPRENFTERRRPIGVPQACLGSIVAVNGTCSAVVGCKLTCALVT